MYIMYVCGNCKEQFQGRKNCLKHETACYAAEQAGVCLEKLPKTLTTHNIDKAVMHAEQMVEYLQDVQVFLNDSSPMVEQSFFLGGDEQQTTEDDDGKDRDVK